jgi:hypothetical protein
MSRAAPNRGRAEYTGSRVALGHHVNDSEDQHQPRKGTRRRSLLRRCAPHEVTPTDIEISANPNLAGSQSQSGDTSPRSNGAAEAKIEANSEGKIELESEALAGLVTTHRRASSRLRGRAVPAAAGLRCRPAETGDSAIPATGSQPGSPGAWRPERLSP